MSGEEKAINLLQSADIDKETGDVQWHTWYKGIDEDVKEAFDIAIRHIQAWDKAKEEVRHFMIDINPSSSESDYACNYIFDIINKHLQEVDK